MWLSLLAIAALLTAGYILMPRFLKLNDEFRDYNQDVNRFIDRTAPKSPRRGGKVGKHIVQGCFM